MAKKKQRSKKRKLIGSRITDRLRAKKNRHPNDLAKLLDKATKLHQTENLVQAEQVYRQVLSIDPRNVAALWRLGIVCHQSGRIDEGILLVNNAVSIQPDFADGHNSLGILLQEKGDLDGAVSCFQKALAINPALAEAHNNLGNAYLDQKEFERAIESFHKALAMKPDFAEVCYNLAKVYKRQGLIDEAKESYRKALAIRPDYAEAHRYLSRLRKYSGYDGHMREMDGLMAREGGTDYQRMHLAFALGKAYGDFGEYEKSFDYLLIGNRLKRKYIHYSTAETKAYFDTIKKVFDHSFVLQNLDRGNPDDTPVFILGMPRSGTSLVEQILASHPDVYGGGELDDFRQITLRLTKSRLPEEAFACLPGDNGRIIKLIGPEYLKAIRRFSSGARFITDKMPHNFLLIGVILLALPKAKIIHCVRDPSDNCFSVFRNYFSHEHNYAYDLEELGEYHLLYQDLMHYWHDVFPGMIYDISYEKLVSDQEGESRKLMTRCGLAWSESCLTFYKTPGAVSTMSAAEVRKPIYRDSVQLWKRYEKQLQPLTEVLSRSRNQENL